MRISFAETRSKTNIILLAAIVLTSCSPGPGDNGSGPAVVKADQAFAPAGDLEMQLAGGGYTIRASSDDHIRVSFAGNTGNATADLQTNGTHASLAIRDTPNNNFQATIEVPATTNLTVHLSGGNLEVAAITGNKDIDSKAGNVGIAIPSANDYSSVDASVTAGNLNGGPFGDSASGVAPHLKWSGSGKYTLHVSLGAGDLEFKH